MSPHDPLQNTSDLSQEASDQLDTPSNASKAGASGVVSVSDTSLETDDSSQKPERKRSRKTTRARLPKWLRANIPAGNSLLHFNSTSGKVAENQLTTVCEEAKCPNIHDCWTRGTATFMIGGDVCTRGCHFCSVKTMAKPPLPDPEEPQHLAEAIARMQLEHAVITVVNRDDLEDEGTSHYKSCIEAVHAKMPQITIELLGSDLAGNLNALEYLLEGIPLAVFAHNVESVPRLDHYVRDARASFKTSLKILSEGKRLRPDLYTKSSLMVGCGESDEEITEALKMLRDADVEIVTLGQYLAPGRPGERFIPVDRYVVPEQFEIWDSQARELGFKGVASGPMVRSSYRAGLLLKEAQTGQRLIGDPWKRGLEISSGGSCCGAGEENAEESQIEVSSETLMNSLKKS